MKDSILPDISFPSLYFHQDKTCADGREEGTMSDWFSGERTEGEKEGGVSKRKKKKKKSRNISVPSLHFHQDKTCASGGEEGTMPDWRSGGGTSRGEPRLRAARY